MKATWAFGPSTRSPSTKAWPSLGAASPEPILSKVDLPQPEGPISDTTSPSRTAMLTPCTAVRLWPPSWEKRIVTLRYSRRIKSVIEYFQLQISRRVSSALVVSLASSLACFMHIPDHEFPL